MKFKNFTFKLLVIDELMLLKLITPEMAKILKKHKEGYYNEYFEKILDADPDSEDYDPDADVYGCHPEMEEEIAEMDIPASYLEKIKKIDFEYGQIHNMLAPQWHGEDEMFKVTDMTEIVQLKNLEKIGFSFILPDEDEKKMDFTPLLKLPNLKKISFINTYPAKSWLEAQKVVFQKLEAKGVAVPKK